MTVKVYAVLKDYFEQEFLVDASVNSIEELRALLLQKNPASENILAICRFAVNDIFVDNNFELQANDSIHIIPPSSGG